MGTGYSSSSAGDKPDKRKRQDAKQMEEQINELVDGDAVMSLELLEYMTGPRICHQYSRHSQCHSAAGQGPV